MILTFLMQILTNILQWLSSVLPIATTLPFGFDDLMVNGIGYLKYATNGFPPLGTLLTAFSIYLGFIVALKIIKLVPVIRHAID